MKDHASILITGNAGFVGKAFAKSLGHWKRKLKGVDLRGNGQDVRDYFNNSDERFDLVLHCAANVGGRAKMNQSPLSVGANLGLDAAMFEWAMRTEPTSIVYFSSAAAYPLELQREGSCRELRESDIWHQSIRSPDGLYGMAKLVGEMQANLANQCGLNVLTVRPFPAYGPDQSLDYPFPALIDRIKRREDPLTVWGDGSQVRDWIHIDDLVNAVLTAVDKGVQGPVNLCTGVGTSFKHLVEEIVKQAGYDPKIEYLTDKPTGVHYRVGNPDKLNEFYTPKISVEQGIAMMLEKSQENA